MFLSVRVDSGPFAVPTLLALASVLYALATLAMLALWVFRLPIPVPAILPDQALLGALVVAVPPVADTVPLSATPPVLLVRKLGCCSTLSTVYLQLLSFGAMSVENTPPFVCRSRRVSDRQDVSVLLLCISIQRRRQVAWRKMRHNM